MIIAKDGSVRVYTHTITYKKGTKYRFLLSNYNVPTWFFRVRRETALGRVTEKNLILLDTCRVNELVTSLRSFNEEFEQFNNSPRIRVTKHHVRFVLDLEPIAIHKKWFKGAFTEYSIDAALNIHLNNVQRRNQI